MSTKTIYKRIALVAVATLGAGLLSVAPANAVISALSNTKVQELAAGAVNLNQIIEEGGSAGDRTYAIYTGGAATLTLADIELIQTLTGAAGDLQRVWIAPGTISKTAAAVAVYGVFPATDVGGTVSTAAAPAITGSLTLVGTPAGITATTLAASQAGTVYTIQGHLENVAAGTPAAGNTRAVVTVYSRTIEATLGDGGAPTAKGAVNGVAGPANTVTLRAIDSDNTAGAFNLKRLVTVSGAGAKITTASAAPVAVATDGLTAVITGNNAAPSFNTLTILTPQVGTVTVSSFTETAEGSGIFGSTAASTVTVTVNAAGVAGNVDTATTTATINAGATHAGTADSTTVAASSSASTTPVAVVKVVLAATSGTVTSTTAVRASIAGPGVLVLNDNNDHTTSAIGTGRSLSSTVATTTTTFHVLVQPDGTSGVSTITITAGAYTVTKSLTFYGAITTLTAVQNHKIASIAGAALGVGTAAPSSADIANTPGVVISARDAAGVLVPNATITAVSSDTTIMQSEITVAGVTAAPGTYNASVSSVANTSGKTATLTFRAMSGTTVLASAAPITYTLGGPVASVALSLDAASYDSGAPVVATITVKDASGNAAFDADHADILADELTSSLSVTKTLKFNTSDTIVSSLGGVSTVSFNAPGTSAAAWTISGKTGTGPSAAAEKGKALSATAAVTNASADAATDAANEATDAANAATDAALAAADAADAATAAAQDAADAVAALSTRVSTLVSNLRKQITALTKLVQRLL